MASLSRFSNGARNANDCVIDGLSIDGCHLANVGVEVYDENVAGGNWRNRTRNCAVWNVTKETNPTAVYLGLTGAAPSFSNDPILEAVFIYNAARGFASNGAINRLIACTVLGCSDAAMHAGPASVWNTEACVFSSNGRDFDGPGDSSVHGRRLLVREFAVGDISSGQRGIPFVSRGATRIPSVMRR